MRKTWTNKFGGTTLRGTGNGLQVRINKAEIVMKKDRIGGENEIKDLK